MKILLLGLPALKCGFQELGHDVLICTTDNSGDINISEIPISIDRVLEQLPHDWNPDFVLLTDESTHPLFLGLERLEVPVGWYAIDSHIHHRWHQAYASVFDLVFVAQRDFAQSYIRDPLRQKAYWLPLFCPLVRSKKSHRDREHRMSFVGSVNPNLNPVRCRLLGTLQQAYPLYVATGNYVPIYTNSKMVLNQCVNNDVNFRTFEAMACGSLLVMERVGNGLEELFQDGIHCVLYEKNNVEQIIQIVNYYDSHEEECAAIADVGYSEVQAKHTGVHRAQTVLDRLALMDCQSVLRQRKSQQGEILYLLAPVYEYAASCYERAQKRSSHNLSLGKKWMAVAERFRHVSGQIHHELRM